MNNYIKIKNLTKKYEKKIVDRPIVNKLPNLFLFFKAENKQKIRIAEYIKSKPTPPKKPNSSAIVVKIKSVCL